MAVMPSSIHGSSPLDSPIKPPAEVFKIPDGTFQEFFNEDDVFKHPMSSTTNTTSSLNEDEVRASDLFLSYPHRSIRPMGGRAGRQAGRRGRWVAGKVCLYG